MNTRRFMKMVFVALLSLPTGAFAQFTIDRRVLPDLVPVDVTLAADCRLIVALANNGPGIVPDAGFGLTSSSAVQMYKDGAPWGGIALGALDTRHLLQPAGGSVNYAWPSGLALPAGPHVIRLDVDPTNAIAESNEVNNSLTKTLTCTPPLPDLQPVSFNLVPTGVAVTSPCRIIVTLRNNGPTIVSDAAFAKVSTGPGLQMWKDGGAFGGAVLGLIDVAMVLQPVGGTLTYTWLMGADFLVSPGTHTLRLDVDTANTLAESNEGNNSLTQTVTCGTTISPPPLQP